MLERIVSLFERIAVALERLAVVQSTGFLPPAPPKPVAGGLAHSEGGSKKPPTEKKQNDAFDAAMKAEVSPLAGTSMGAALGLVPAVDFMAPVPVAAPTQTAPPAGVPTRDDVGNALVDLATADRDQAIKILAGFGAQKLGQVKESDYPALIQTLNKAIAALPPKVA